VFFRQLNRCRIHLLSLLQKAIRQLGQATELLSSLSDSTGHCKLLKAITANKNKTARSTGEPLPVVSHRSNTLRKFYDFLKAKTKKVKT